jgi:VWFA-related protein
MSKASLVLLSFFSILLPLATQTPQQFPAQQTQASPSPTPQESPTLDDKDETVRITTNLVQVDAVVTKDGKLVTDLKADDFELFEDGRRQTITSFAYISNLTNSASPTNATAPVKVDNDRNTPSLPVSPIRPTDPHRTIAMVIDDLGLSAESMSQVRKQLRKFVDEQLQPSDLVAIIRTGGDVGALQQFTNDKRLLYGAIEKARWNICSRVGPTVFQPLRPTQSAQVGGDIQMSGPQGAFGQDGSDAPCGWRSLTSTMHSLRFILQSMRELPGRKSMVIFSDSIPREEQEVKLPDSGDDSDAFGGNSRNFDFVLQKLAEIAIRGSIVIYGVDTQGLQTTGPTAADMFAGTNRQMTTQINALQRSRSLLLVQRREGAELLARETGGFLVRNSNDFGLDRISRDQQGYYLLGYRPSEETFDRRFHHIKARVKRSGLSLRTRFGFYGITEDEAKRAQRTTADKTNLALVSPFGAHDIAVELTALFANSPASGSLVRSFLYLSAKDLTFVDAADGWHESNVEVRGIIFGNNGEVVDQVTRLTTLRLRGQTYEQALSEGISLRFDMPVKRSGSFQVRVAARDIASSRIGSAGQFVSVPDLNNKRLAVSGIILRAASGEQPAKPQAPHSDVTETPRAVSSPATPEGDNSGSPAVRRFSPGSNVLFACAIYNALLDTSSHHPQLTVQAQLFHDGKAVYSSPPMPVDVANQSDLGRVVATGVVRINSDLEPGRYFLQLVVNDSLARIKQGPVVQWIDFEVVKN